MLSDTLSRHKNKVAAVIIEPIAGNMGMIMPDKDFLTGVRQLW